MSAAASLMAATALASVAGSYATNVRNMANQMDINSKNMGLQLAYNADQVAVAQMNNQTQIDLANTAHQREVQDLRDAGLNPILSATGGNGAAMPSLSSPNGNAPELQAYNAQNPLSELGTSARQIGMMMTDQYKAETAQAIAQADYQQSMAQVARYEAENARRETALNATKTKLELDAYKTMEDPAVAFDEDGNLLIRSYAGGAIPIDPEIVEAVAAGIKADIHNQRWSDVQKWLGVVNDTARTVSGAALNSANAASSLKNASLVPSKIKLNEAMTRKLNRSK